MSDTRRRSPLAHRAPIEAPDGAAAMAEKAFLGKLVLRADPARAAPVMEAMDGIGPPPGPNRSRRCDRALILWLAPDEWLLVTDPGAESTLLADLAAALAGIPHQLVDVTDQHTTIEIAGRRTREMLMKLTTLDLHPRAFRRGAVAGSLFGKAAATLCQTRDDGAGGPAFELIVRRSLADYLWCLLAEAGREFALPEQVPRAGETLRA